jgi:hypothetical protein
MLRSICYLIFAVFSLSAHAQPIEPPVGADHRSWDELLQRYVDNHGIFSWHSVDFENEVSACDVLRRFGPEDETRFLEKVDYKIKDKDYHWGLNNQSDLGADYEHSIFNKIS